MNLQALEQALSVVEKLGQGEVTFDVGDTRMSLRMLMPDEEVAVQRYSQEAIRKDSETADGTDRSSAMDFLDRFKQAVVAYSLCQIGSLDLRGVETLETGEVLPNGNPVRVSRPMAVRKLTERWTRPVLLAVFKKYTELTESVEAASEKAIEFSPSDLDAEIERVEKRLTELKTTKEQRTAPAVQSQVKAVQDLSNLHQDELRRTQAIATEEEAPRPEPVRASPVRPAPVAAQPEARRPVTPQVAPPPTRPNLSNAPVVAPPSTLSAPPTGEPVQDALSGVQDSFVDVVDDDSLAAENRRLLETRRRITAERQAALVAAEMPTQTRRMPPHRQIDPEAAAIDMGITNPLAGAQQVGSVDGKEAYRLPPEILSERGRQQGSTKAAIREMNVAPTGNVNPRFRGNPKP